MENDSLGSKRGNVLVDGPWVSGGMERGDSIPNHIPGQTELFPIDVLSFVDVQPFINHGAVVDYGCGVSSEDLANFHGRLMCLGEQRFLGVGQDQYLEDGKQKFEKIPMEDLIGGLIEEVVDCQNYLSMVLIQALSALSSVTPPQKTA